jgi:hypothetical protein
MTEEQRMEEGRRMFQIFAARMFEQRVLSAYREKVSIKQCKRPFSRLRQEKINYLGRRREAGPASSRDRGRRTRSC